MEDIKFFCLFFMVWALIGEKWKVIKKTFADIVIFIAMVLWIIQMIIRLCGEING